MMFAPTTALFSNPSSRATVPGAYRQIGVATAVEGASPHKLVSLLFDALVSEIACARGALLRGDVGEKGRAIGHAVRILQEGLISPLDMQGGGEIAANLRDVYDYVVMRLTHANLHNDPQALVECQRLITPIQEAWTQIQPSANLTRAAA